MLANRIRQDMTAALKAGDSLRLSVLRLLLSALDYKRIDLRREPAETDVINVIRNEARKRREAVVSYTQGGRTEQAKVEQAELEVLLSYLPPQLADG